MNAIEIPRRLRALARDSRGYPIPFTVYRDLDGKPHFAVTNEVRVNRCKLEGRCPICGYKLDKLKWFTGGPASAFHPNGFYIDPAMHEECMRFSLRTCPYLSHRNYQKRVDVGTVNLDRIEPQRIFMDNTVIDERPAVMVAVASLTQERLPMTAEKLIYVRPGRPFQAVEYWRHGQRVTLGEAKELLGELSQYLGN